MRGLRILIVTIVAVSLASQASAWDPEYDEEPGGASFNFQFNPSDEIYGISFGDGSWIRDTPIFGDYFLTVFQNGIEDATYSGVGMTIRLMPHWVLAPFVGVGGSYNYSLSGGSDDQAALAEAGVLEDLGDSYWGWHGEAGFRVATDGALGMFELSARYTANTLDGDDRDYWFAGIGCRATR